MSASVVVSIADITNLAAKLLIATGRWMRSRALSQRRWSIPTSKGYVPLPFG
jgi:hypothetical protein